MWRALWLRLFYCFFFNNTATTEIYTLSLHDALPILHLLDGVGPLVDVELLLLLPVHPRVVVVAPERIGPAHDLVAGQDREYKVGVRIGAPAPDEHVVVGGVDGVGKGRVAYGLGLQTNARLLEPALDKLALRYGVFVLGAHEQAQLEFLAVLVHDPVAVGVLP